MRLYQPRPSFHAPPILKPTSSTQISQNESRFLKREVADTGADVECERSAVEGIELERVSRIIPDDWLGAHFRQCACNVLARQLKSVGADINWHVNDIVCDAQSSFEQNVGFGGRARILSACQANPGELPSGCRWKEIPIGRPNMTRTSDARSPGRIIWPDMNLSLFEPYSVPENFSFCEYRI